MGNDAREEFGPLLRQAREKRGVSLQQVAATTKISARVLDALERNDPSKLPGGIFSRAFVRAYAKEVGLDPEETVNRFVAAFPPNGDDAVPQSANRVDAEGFESRRRTAMTLIQIVGLSIIVVIVVAVYMNTRQAPSRAISESSTIAAPASEPAPGAPPVAVTAVAADAAAPAAAPSGSSGGGPSVPGPGGALPMPGATPAPAATPAGVPADATSALPAGARSSPVPAAPPQADVPLSIVITADAECWLSLTADGERLVARNLQPGERVTYGARTAIVISAGNAGALSVTINGRPVRPLGARGAVVTATITPETLKNFLQ